MRHLIEQRHMLYFFVAIGILTMIVMLKVELPLLLGMDLKWEQKIDAYRTLLHVHAIFGSIALFSAPIQFFSTFRKRHLLLHRRLGRTYALSILIAAPIGIYIALAHLSNSEKWAVVLQGLLWLGTTAAAVHTAWHKKMTMHQLWIARSYALTLTFVASRFIVDVLKIEVSPAIGGNAGLTLISTVVMILLADAVCLRAQHESKYQHA